jgi:hypothetical protein
VVFEVVVDHYAEVWVNGAVSLTIDTVGGHVVAGFNALNRAVLTRGRPGQTFTIAVCGINGPISVSPHNYSWMRTSTLDFYTTDSAQTGTPTRVTSLGTTVMVAPGLRIERSTWVSGSAGGRRLTRCGRTSPTYSAG